MAEELILTDEENATLDAVCNSLDGLRSTPEEIAAMVARENARANMAATKARESAAVVVAKNGPPMIDPVAMEATMLEFGRKVQAKITEQQGIPVE